MTWIRDDPKCLHAKNITEAIDGSLRRLQTDYIGLIGFYVPMFGEIEYDPTRKFSSIPIDEQLDALGIAVDSGKIRYVGLSNETPYGVMKFVQVAARHPKIVSVTHTACSVELLILGWLNAVIMRRIQSVGFQKK
ncbi:aldo-keto reductase-like isoform X2 [Prunus avium]|uniref:Aldo-keto reductase-like isoform X2 n=1 Tax=Prunus avium TaxID=42229 RepID=A0A6P5SXZ8_PRUAV|nr:aldo-keto reductase-like isoform X2 [Prunus avium]